MKKFNLKNIFAMTALLCAAFVFAGCEGLGSDAQSIAPQFFYGGAADGGTAYITLGKVKANEVGISRTVVPEAVGPEGFSNFEFSMLDETAPNPHVTLASAATFEELSSQVIEVAVGERTFTLRATRGGVTFGGSTTATLTKGATTALSFTLTAEPSAKGGICVTVNATGQVVCASYILEGPGAARNEPAEFTKTPTGATATVNLSDLDAGVWTLSITFYGDEARTNPLNTYKELVRVSPGLVSRAERDIDLNDLYKITYHDLPQGWAVAEWETDSSLPMNYSRKSGAATGGTINLPDLSAAGLYFAGYYSDAGFTVTKSQIDVSEARDLDIYPLFTDTIYVSASGDNDNSGWTLNGALPTIEAATGKISTIGLEHQNEGCPYENMDWKILIDGALTANSSMYLSPVLDSRAGSVTLRGLGSGGALSMASGVKETVLKITTTTPIVIENLTISGGGGGVGAVGASGSGGGISIGEETLSQLAANVTVGSGVVITNNQAGNYGGGIFACQDSVLTLTGDAVIGDPSKTNPASDCANKAAYGGGIAVKGGKVIFDSDFTGSVCGNYSGSNGGGVYMESAVGFEMNGGLIKNNKAGGGFADSGDGVYVSGAFSMSGGARVDASNTVPLYGALTITGPITGTKPVVTIYPGNDYSGRTTPVLKDNVGGSLVAQCNDKFAVVPEGGTTWYIGDDGKLTNIDPSSLVSLYVKAGGNDALDGRSPETALATLGGAVAKMTDWLNHFNIYIMTDLALGGTPVVFDAPSQSITIKSADGTQKTIDGQFTAENPGTVLKFKTGSVPVTIENIKIFGGCAYVDGEGKNQGGGIHVAQYANVVLGAGARVEGNKKDSGAKGGGVYVEYLANFSMKDDAVVYASESSDVYLNTDGKITIASALTGKTSDTVLYVAQITPPPGGYGYTTDPIIEVPDGSGTTLEAVCGKFKITPIVDGGGTREFIIDSSDGCVIEGP